MKPVPLFVPLGHELAQGFQEVLNKSDSAIGNVGEHSSRKVPSSLIKKPAFMVGYSRGNSKQISLGRELISYRIVYKVCYHRNDKKMFGS
jgi:hypothetical protein